jgi:hypothetical protein
MESVMATVPAAIWMAEPAPTVGLATVVSRIVVPPKLS